MRLRRRKNEGTTVRTGFVFDQNGRIQDLPLDARPILVPEDRLGAVLEGEGTAIRGHIRLIRLKHSLSALERAALRKYIIERGGMLFFDDCGFNGMFAAIVADELHRIFPEYPLEYLPHHHEIYNIYYQLPQPPTGGDVFWGSENYAKVSKFRHQIGLTINNRLAVVFNRKDYMCAMETVEVESRTMLRLRRSNDVRRFMTNLLVYAMKYGGNTDRSRYKP